MYSVNDTIAYDEISFSNFKFTKTDTLPEGIKRENVDYFHNDDENGVLNAGNYYMFVDCDVTNLTDQKQEYYLNQARFVELNENLDLIQGSGEPRSIRCSPRHSTWQSRHSLVLKSVGDCISH